MIKFLVVGGNSGIGLAMALELIKRENAFVYIVGKDAPREQDIPTDLVERFQAKASFYRIDLTQDKLGYFDEVRDIDGLIITAGFGRVAPLEELTSAEVDKLIKCNMLGAISVIKKYYDKIHSHTPFYPAD